jgi:hypothetical protein
LYLALRIRHCALFPRFGKSFDHLPHKSRANTYTHHVRLCPVQVVAVNQFGQMPTASLNHVRLPRTAVSLLLQDKISVWLTMFLTAHRPSFVSDAQVKLILSSK